MVRRYEVTDEQWRIIEPHLGNKEKRTGRPQADNRKLFNGVLWILRTGAPWRDLPEYYGPWQTVYKRFAQWQLDISQSVVLADKAYGSVENRKYISDRGAQYCIPPKEGLSKPWKCDYFHYKERHLVECFFMKIKDYRRVAMRFEKLARRF